MHSPPKLGGDALAQRGLGWFYERGCQDKYSPADRRRGVVLATSPRLRRDDLLSERDVNMPPFVIASVCPEKLKSVWRLLCCRPWFYWSLDGLMLFQVMRGGIESVWVFDRSRGPIAPRILTLDLIRSEHTDDERLRFIVSAGKSFRTAMSSNSVSSDRTFLLSSKFSARPPRSCAPVSAAPFLCACPCFSKP